MMTCTSDRELLVMAALAAGYRLEEAGVGGEQKFYLPGEMEPWNPLTDDGDALRLARSTNLRVDFNYCTGSDKRLGVAVWTPGDDSPYPPFWTLYGKKPDVDVRCTIVRAAVSMNASE